VSSPVIDFSAICTAFAARFVAATIGTPASPATAMRASYANTPKNVPVAPSHLLEVNDGTVVATPGQWKHEMNVDGLLLLAKRPADPERVEALRKLWLPFLLHATVDAMKITLGGAVGYSVDKALPTGWEFTEFPVGGVEFDAIRVHWTIYVTENVMPTP
jgi:hypothetical protein